MPKMRLDTFLVENNIIQSRERAKALILAGKVFVDGKRCDKAGTNVDERNEVLLKESDIPYVSRGGVKLKGALDSLGINVENLCVLDIGASTGGFTDCLLQSKADRIIAIDVGYGQLDWKLRQDPRVFNIERVNARYLEELKLPSKADAAVMDVSFISVTKILPSIPIHLKDGGWLLTLVKPQFEVGPKYIGKAGVVKDEKARLDSIQHVKDYALQCGYTFLGEVQSSLSGANGNIEHFLWLKAPAKTDLT